METHFTSEKISLKMNCATVYSLESEELIELYMELNSSKGHLEEEILPCALTYYISLNNMTTDIEASTKYFVSLYVRDSPCDLLINGNEQFSFEIKATKKILSRE